jgi:hypothetical protein
MANLNRQTYSLVISSAADGPVSAEALDAVYRKLSWRLMPLLCMCIMLNYLDRTSLSFASIQMTEQLQFSPEVMGLGGGLFFVSYCLMQVRTLHPIRCYSQCAGQGSAVLVTMYRSLRP